MKDVTPEIISAIRTAAAAHGSLSQLAAAVGVSHGTLSRYISGQVKSIDPLTWKSLYPAIAHYLPEIEIRISKPDFESLTIAGLRRILNGAAIMPVEIREEVAKITGLKKEIDAWLNSEPQYANFYLFFDKLQAKRMPFKHAFAAAQVYCESRGYEIPLRYQARRRMRAGKQ